MYLYSQICPNGYLTLWPVVSFVVVLCGQTVSDPLQHTHCKNRLSLTANCFKLSLCFGPQGDRFGHFQLSHKTIYITSSTDTF
jgi:hypothetical protein